MLIFYSLGKTSFHMFAKIFYTHIWVVEASEKLPEQQIDDSITEIEFDEIWYFIK